MKKIEYKPKESYYSDMLGKVREEIIGAIGAALTALGGKVNVRYYHDDADIDRYAFFDIDDNGHGYELYIKSVYYNEHNEVEVALTDSEDCYDAVWPLDYFNASNADYLLYELEQIIEYVNESGEGVVSEMEED